MYKIKQSLQKSKMNMIPNILVANFSIRLYWNLFAYICQKNIEEEKRQMIKYIRNIIHYQYGA